MGAKTSPEKRPRIFMVNWFRKDARGKFMWPGFGDNSRVLEGMFARCEAEEAAAAGKPAGGAGAAGGAIETPIGLIPDVAKGALNTEGLGMSAEALADLFKIDPAVWSKEFTRYGEFLATFGDRLPAGIREQHDRFSKRAEDAVAGKA
jgi:phosphoenolpyruvate carboxykinase (GTP)